MKTKILYLMLIVTMLLSACSAASAGTNQSVNAPVNQASEISATVTPDQDPPQGGPTGGGTPPQEAMAACSGLSEQATCSFTDQNGDHTGVCETVQSQLACSPARDSSGGGQQSGNQSNGDQVQAQYLRSSHAVLP